MKRYIDAESLKDTLQFLAYDDLNQGVPTTLANAYSKVADMIDDFPSADVQEVRRGRWIQDSYGAMDDGEYLITRCSYCGEANPVSNYCPNCGADNRDV